MPTHTCLLDIIWLSLDDGTQLGCPVLFPELSGLGLDRAIVRRRLTRNARLILESLDPGCVSTRQPSLVPNLSEVDVEIVPPGGVPGKSVRSAWQEPKRTRFFFATWDHGDSVRLAYEPLLGVQVISQWEEEIEELVRAEIQFAIRRDPQPISLRGVSFFRRVVSAEVERVSYEADIKTLRQYRSQTGQVQRSELEKVASKLSSVTTAPVYEREGLVSKVAESFQGSSPRSVLLVGPSGVGKTAIVHGLYRNRAALGLGERPFWQTSGARIVAGMSGFGMWEERCQALIREASREKPIIHFGNLVELLQVGKSEANDRGVGDFLATHFERGDLLGIVECTAEQFAFVDREVPRVLQAFFRIDVSEPDERASRVILDQSARWLGRRRHVTVDDQAVETLERLHRRYATYSSVPGRPIRFLRRLISSVPDSSTVSSSAVTEAFLEETGLPLLLLEDTCPFDLEAAGDWLARRVKGQARAVDVIVDLLASVKAGLTQPTKPIASLLFIGPTGVGKTEMAKSLAEFLYCSRERITRIDMSEYAEPGAAARLVEGVSGAEGVLTSKVREQPFGVILLDEFEKAHPAVFDLLLQVLGEGRLTDGQGRLADFRNSVIIMTSNLGSESFGRGTVGFSGTRESGSLAEEHFLRAVRDSVRPEFFNRVDCIVPFQTLSEATLHAIAEREMELLKMREGMFVRDLDFEWTEAATRRIVEIGSDPRYGARPIKRSIDQHLVAPLSAALNRTTEPQLSARVDASREGFGISVRSRPDGSSSFTDTADSVQKRAENVVDLRRSVTDLAGAEPIGDIRAEVFQAKRAAARARRRAVMRAARDGVEPAFGEEPVSGASRAEELIDRVDQLATDSCALEEQMLLSFYTGSHVPAVARLRELQNRIEMLYFDVYAHRHPESNKVTVVVYKDLGDANAPPMFELAQAYYQIARNKSFEIDVHYIMRCSATGQPTNDRFAVGYDRTREDDRREGFAGSTPDVLLEANRVKEPDRFLGEPSHGILGIALQMVGPFAQPLFAPESGIHILDTKGVERKCLVDTSNHRLQKYRPPDRIGASSLADRAVRRTCCVGRRTVDDRLMEKMHWKGKDLPSVLQGLIENRFLAELREWFA